MRGPRSAGVNGASAPSANPTAQAASPVVSTPATPTTTYIHAATHARRVSASHTQTLTRTLSQDASVPLGLAIPANTASHSNSVGGVATPIGETGEHGAAASALSGVSGGAPDGGVPDFSPASGAAFTPLFPHAILASAVSGPNSPMLAAGMPAGGIESVSSALVAPADAISSPVNGRAPGVVVASPADVDALDAAVRAHPATLETLLPSVFAALESGVRAFASQSGGVGGTDVPGAADTLPAKTSDSAPSSAPAKPANDVSSRVLAVWEALRSALEEVVPGCRTHAPLSRDPSGLGSSGHKNETPYIQPRPLSWVNVHGETWSDEFAFLNDRTDPQVLEYIQAENTYSERAMAHTRSLRRMLYREFISRIDNTSVSASVTMQDGWTYFTRMINGKDYSEHVRTRLLRGAEAQAFVQRLHDRLPSKSDPVISQTKLETSDFTTTSITIPAGAFGSAAGRLTAVTTIRKSPDGKADKCETQVEDVFFDENIFADSDLYADASYFAVGFIRFSPDCRYVALGVDDSGNERYKVSFLELETKQWLPDRISDVYEDFEWSNDGSTVYYTLLDEYERAYKLCKHVLGTDPAVDPVLYHEVDESFYLRLKRTISGNFIIVDVYAQVTSEVWFIDADAPSHPPVLLMPREEGVTYSVQDRNGWFYVLTNKNCKNNYIYRIPIIPAGEQADLPTAPKPIAQTVIEHRDFVFIEEFQVRRDFLVVFERSNCLQNVRIVDFLDSPSSRADSARSKTSPSTSPTQPFSPSTGPHPRHAYIEPPHPSSTAHPDFSRYHYISFTETIYSLFPNTLSHEITNLLTSTMYSSRILRFTYASFVTPRQVVDYDMRTRRMSIAHAELVYNYDPGLYVQRRAYATGTDGTAIPLSIVYRRDLRNEVLGNPCLLHSYGAYGQGMNIVFSQQRLSLLDRGVVFAIAHVRGGGEMGNAWYQEGKLAKKPNTFLDFIACAELLIKEHYTTPKQLAIFGRSAGGLLIGAAATMRPDLFKAAVMHVPFVDVINTMFDSSIPWTAFEYEEWGNPADPDIYQCMKSYCPYTQLLRLRDQLARGQFPDLLVVGGMNDPRVAFWEPLKFVARIRDVKRCADREKEASSKTTNVSPTNMAAAGASAAPGAVISGTKTAAPRRAGHRRHDHVVLLQMADVGHSGSGGQYGHLEELAFEYAFILDRLGAAVHPRPPPSSMTIATANSQAAKSVAPAPAVADLVAEAAQPRNLGDLTSGAGAATVTVATVLGDGDENEEGQEEEAVEEMEEALDEVDDEDEDEVEDDNEEGDEEEAEDDTALSGENEDAGTNGRPSSKGPGSSVKRPAKAEMKRKQDGGRQNRLLSLARREKRPDDVAAPGEKSKPKTKKTEEKEYRGSSRKDRAQAKLYQWLSNFY